MELLAFFPDKIFLDIPAFEISNVINLAFENLNFHRFVHMSFYFLLTLLVIKFCKDEINQKILKYWLIFPLFNFFNSFQHQHDSFVVMTSILLINKIFKSNEKKHIIISLFYLDILQAISPSLRLFTYLYFYQILNFLRKS